LLSKSKRLAEEVEVKRMAWTLVLCATSIVLLFSACAAASPTTSTALTSVEQVTDTPEPIQPPTASLTVEPTQHPTAIPAGISTPEGGIPGATTTYTNQQLGYEIAFPAEQSWAVPIQRLYRAA
jgi:hypothetical protein